ncbi:hypothetical protein D3C73_1288560 [compost metagenome]
MKRGRSTPLADAFRSSVRYLANGCTMPLMDRGAVVYTRPVTFTLAGCGLVDDTAVIAPSMADSSAT